MYTGISFGGKFKSWSDISSKPMFLGEYGADAFNNNILQEDLDSQAKATTALTQEIYDNSAINGGVCLGGVIFEFNDEWWKSGKTDVHDIHGTAPGGGPFPDSYFNEEWWGLVTVDRQKRPAYAAYAAFDAQPKPKPSQPDADKPNQPDADKPNQPEKCSTVTSIEIDQCFKHIDWAMNYGIKQSPQKYPGLTSSSSLQEFQNFLHKNLNICPYPACPQQPVQPDADHVSDVTCLTVTSIEIDQCFNDIDWAMNHGIKQSPQKYPGLTSSSSLQEFQNFLHKNLNICPYPACPQLHQNLNMCPHPACPQQPDQPDPDEVSDVTCLTVTSIEIDQCFKHIDWAMNHGIKQSPQKYP
eukprot:Pgem_evm2s8559